MDLTVAVVLAILAAMPVAVWVIWWLLADLGEAATGSHGTVHHGTTAEPRRRAA